MRLIRLLIRSIIKQFGYDVTPIPKKERSSLPPDFPPEIVQTYEKNRLYTMTGPERIFSLVKATEHIVHHNIAGAIVECGVWRGGSMMVVAETLLRLKAANRVLFLFDTFEGMPPAQDMDRSFRGEYAANLMAEQDPSISRVWAVAQQVEVQQNMQQTGYPQHLINYVEGRVEETIPAQAPDEIALLRLDTDWHESTRHEMEHLFPRLVPGGIIIVDDYGHWAGAKLAVDEYLEKHRIPLFLCRIDYTARMAVKPA